MATDDPAIHDRVMRDLLQQMTEFHFTESPAAMGRIIHRRIRKAVGNPDPYREIKRQSNEFGLAVYPRAKAAVRASRDPFGMAVRLAIAGNLIDFGVKHDLDMERVSEAIDRAAESEIDEAALEGLREAVAAADDILYIGDNAGEIVLDRLLIEQMPAGEVTFAVRGHPIINDATREDAEATGLREVADIIDSGDDAPGTILENCSLGFRERFDRASVVIAKGQGNYETLSEVPHEVFFILKAKCPVIARDLQCEIGATIVRHKRALAVAEGSSNRR